MIKKIFKTLTVCHLWFSSHGLFYTKSSCLGQQAQKLSLKLEALPGIWFTSSESKLSPSPQFSWLWVTKSALCLINFSLSLIPSPSSQWKAIFMGLCSIPRGRKWRAFTFPFILWTVSAKWIWRTTIISPGGAQSFLTVFKTWSGKCPTLCKLLRDRQRNYILKIHSNLDNQSRVQEWSLHKPSFESQACISSIVKNQSGLVHSNIFQYEINSTDNAVLRIMSVDSQHKRGLTLLFFPPTYNCLLSNFPPSGSTACGSVNMRIQFMPRVFLCQPAGSSLPLPLFLPR